MNISKRIAQRREELGLTLDDIAKATGVARSTAGKWANGNIDNMRIDKLESLARVLQTSIDWLLELDEDYALYENAERIPIPKEIETLCSTVKEKLQHTFVKIPDYITADFAVKFKGDSMINARIFDGDTVFISAQDKVENGDICAVLIDNEVHLKRVYKYENRTELRPENPLCQVLNYEGKDRRQIKILGKATAFISAVR